MVEFTQQSLDFSIRRIIEQMKVDGWKPDIIFGIWRGGAVPAIMLSHALGVTCAPLSDQAVLDALYDNLNILIVDEIIDSGHTMKKLLDFYKDIHYHTPQNKIRTATLVLNTAQEFLPDYHFHTIDRTRDKEWVHFPWETEL